MKARRATKLSIVFVWALAFAPFVSIAVAIIGYRFLGMRNSTAETCVVIGTFGLLPISLLTVLGSPLIYYGFRRSLTPGRLCARDSSRADSAELGTRLLAWVARRAQPRSIHLLRPVFEHRAIDLFQDVALQATKPARFMCRYVSMSVSSAFVTERHRCSHVARELPNAGCLRGNRGV